MKEYVVCLSLEPAVRFQPNIDNIILNFEEPEKPKKIIISKIEKTLSGCNVQSGLHFRVFLKANNIKEAINEAKSFTDGIISFITLVTGVGLDIPIEKLAYEITKNVKERDFLQVLHDPLHLPISRRTLDHKLLTLLIDKIIKLEPSLRERVGRAIQWYRMGSMASNIFDKFNCYWIGLEALNPILQEKFSVGDDPVKCPACGHEWIHIPTVSGIRTFIQTKIPEGKKLYKRFHRLRVNLMHSKRALETLYGEATSLVPKIAEVLFRAICFILEVANWEKIPYKGILEKVPLRVELEAILVGGEPESLGPDGQDPFFEPKHAILTFKTFPDKVTFETTSEFTAHLNLNVKWRPREIRIYGDKEVNASITRSEIQRKTNQL
jgi:hypothetical protein